MRHLIKHVPALALFTRRIDRLERDLRESTEEAVLLRESVQSLTRALQGLETTRQEIAKAAATRQSASR